MRGLKGDQSRPLPVHGAALRRDRLTISNHCNVSSRRRLILHDRPVWSAPPPAGAAQWAYTYSRARRLKARPAAPEWLRYAQNGALGLRFYCFREHGHEVATGFLDLRWLFVMMTLHEQFWPSWRRMFELGI